MAVVHGKFVSRKVSKIRWKPVPKTSIDDCDVFTMGTWDNQINTLSVWKCELPSQMQNDSDFAMSVDNEPRLLCETTVTADVTDIKHLNHEMFVMASSDGNVTMYTHDDDQLKVKITWESSHRFRAGPAPCTALDVHTENVVSVGEDGRLIYYSASEKRPLRTIEAADSCTMTAVTYLKQHEVATANMQGQLRFWDLRNNSDDPVRLMLVDGKMQSLTCVALHPTQPSILACGTEDGFLCIWDVRQDKYPVTTFAAHDGPMMELKFHPKLPNHLFTCSMDGAIWHWDSTSLANARSSLQLKAIGEPLGLSSPWLSCGASKHHLDIHSLIPSHNKPVNSLDIADNVLVCGSDNEAVYVIANLNLL